MYLNDPLPSQTRLDRVSDREDDLRRVAEPPTEMGVPTVIVAMPAGRLVKMRSEAVTVEKMTGLLNVATICVGGVVTVAPLVGVVDITVRLLIALEGLHGVDESRNHPARSRSRRSSR